MHSCTLFIIVAQVKKKVGGGKRYKAALKAKVRHGNNGGYMKANGWCLLHVSQTTIAHGLYGEPAMQVCIHVAHAEPAEPVQLRHVLGVGTSRGLLPGAG